MFNKYVKLPEGNNGSAPCQLQEKAKLKFELFLNGRRSGSKVMLGQSFSALEQRGR